MPELLERQNIQELELPPDESIVPPAPPEGLDTALYEHDERASRSDLRGQIAALELELARLFGSAFPRKGIDFSVPGMGGPRMLSVDELEKVRDGIAARVQDVRLRLNDIGYVHEKNRERIEEMLADPPAHKWVRVSNEDIGEPGCKHWHATPRWGPLGMLMGWWRVKISSGCPLAKVQLPPNQPDGDEKATPQATAAFGRAATRPIRAAGSERSAPRGSDRSPPTAVGIVPAVGACRPRRPGTARHRFRHRRGSHPGRRARPRGARRGRDRGA